MHSLLVASAAAPRAAPSAAPSADTLVLHMRWRREEPQAPDGAVAVEEAVHWDPHRTAIIVCDMWDTHWCHGASLRVTELAPFMDGVLKTARKRGVFVIDAPSDTLAFYEGTPQRQRAQQAPHADPPRETASWHSLDPSREPPLPIDDSDGGCDDTPQCQQGPPWPWTRQHAAIEIAPEDAITDQGQEAYNLLAARDITNVILMGVHTNMCVLGRPFGIRRLATLGFQVALMRDMTDTMYNSRMRPNVDHFRGTALVVEHIERYWCPTVASTDLTGEPAFRFAADR